MERIIYNKTLDVHKNGIQFTLQGFETADKLSRQIVISLMASGDAIDFPLEQIVALMYVTTPSAEEPSIIKCEIKDNTIIYDVLPIVEEGITEMQLKILETRPDGAKSVLATPKFAVEVLKSNADDESVQQKPEFTALEEAVARAKEVYDKRFLGMELSEDCIFRAYYADNTVYETDVLKRLFNNGNVLLSQSYARGDSGVRTGEETDNSMYYSNVSKSASLESKAMKEATEDILEDVLKFSGHTAFKVDFTTGEVEYVSPRYNFTVNQGTGELDVEGTAYTFEGNIQKIADDYLESIGADITKLKSATDDIQVLKENDDAHDDKILELEAAKGSHNGRINEIENAHKWVTFGEVTCSGGLSNEYQKWDTYKVVADDKFGELSKYSKVRYILKAGSTVEMDISATLGNLPVGALEISGGGNGELYTFGTGDGYDDATTRSQKTFKAEQDFFSEEFNISKRVINGVIDCEYLKNISVYMKITNPNYSIIDYNFTLEVQVRK